MKKDITDRFPDPAGPPVAPANKPSPLDWDAIAKAAGRITAREKAMYLELCRGYTPEEESKRGLYVDSDYSD